MNHVKFQGCIIGSDNCDCLPPRGRPWDVKMGCQIATTASLRVSKTVAVKNGQVETFFFSIVSGAIDSYSKTPLPCCTNLSPQINSRHPVIFSADDWGVQMESNHLLSMAFRFHYHCGKPGMMRMEKVRKLFSQMVVV